MDLSYIDEHIKAHSPAVGQVGRQHAISFPRLVKRQVSLSKVQRNKRRHPHPPCKPQRVNLVQMSGNTLEADRNLPH